MTTENALLLTVLVLIFVAGIRLGAVWASTEAGIDAHVADVLKIIDEERS